MVKMENTQNVGGVGMVLKIKGKHNLIPERIRDIQKEKNCSYQDAIKFYVVTRKIERGKV